VKIFTIGGTYDYIPHTYPPTGQRPLQS
jgi:hypothetical protein